MAKKEFIGHYISGTHWDREWYRPLPEYRLLLVEVIDILLDLMEDENSSFDYFHLDGQTCVLNDYMEVRPENRERLHKLMLDGRVLVGPWFTMPDLFGPGDEALIRNLLKGREVSHEWGVEPMNVAYTCDMFGHPSQMPQIYNGFGLKHCVLGRGTNEVDTPSFFTWEAADGSQVLTFKLQDAEGYGAFIGSRRAVEQAEKSGSNMEEAEKVAIDSLKSYIGHEMKRSNAPVLCLIDALDHQAPAVDAAKYVRLSEEAQPSISTKHSTLPKFFADADKYAENLLVKKGELRAPSHTKNEYNFLIPNCVSSRVRLKQQNDRCQTLLAKWVEPITAFAEREVVDCPLPGQSYIDLAWRDLLLNHAHDSICGCSIDQVHRDMTNRYESIAILAEQLRAKAFGAITAGFKELATAPDEFTVNIFNPIPFARKEVVDVVVSLPHDYPRRFNEGFAGEYYLVFDVLAVDDKGKLTEIPYQRIERLKRFKGRTVYAIPGVLDEGVGEYEKYTIAVEVDLPAMGFTSLLIRPSKDVAKRHLGSMKTSLTTAENEFIGLEINNNGTINLTDKVTGETYKDLLMLGDSSETGDGWFHVPGLCEELYLSSAATADVAIIADGPEVLKYRLDVKMNLPKNYDELNEIRNIDRIEQVITHYITLRRGAKALEIETKFENKIEDHQLKLYLPTDVNSKTYFAHHPFDLVERKVELNLRHQNWQEAEIAEKPFLDMQAIGDGKKRGLAFLSEAGLHEGGIIDDARRTMQIVLLRSYRRTIGNVSEPDGLELGKFDLKYRIMPFAGKLQKAAMMIENAKLQTGLMTSQTGKLKSGFPEMKGDKNPRISFVKQEGTNLVLSAFKSNKAGDLVIRMWNPENKVQSDTLTFYKNVKSVKLLNMAEEEIKNVDTVVKDKKSVKVKANGKQVITFLVTLEGKK